MWVGILNKFLEWLWEINQRSCPQGRVDRGLNMLASLLKHRFLAPNPEVLSQWLGVGSRMCIPKERHV